MMVKQRIGWQGMQWQKIGFLAVICTVFFGAILLANDHRTSNVDAGLSGLEAELQECFNNAIVATSRDQVSPVSCFISMLDSCLAISDFVSCQEMGAGVAEATNKEMLDSGLDGQRPTVKLQSAYSQKKQICSGTIDIETKSQCDLTAELELLEGLILLSSQ